MAQFRQAVVSDNVESCAAFPSRCDQSGQKLTRREISVLHFAVLIRKSSQFRGDNMRLKAGIHSVQCEAQENSLQHHYLFTVLRFKLQGCDGWEIQEVLMVAPLLSVNNSRMCKRYTRH